jgi:hypothetical protein
MPADDYRHASLRVWEKIRERVEEQLQPCAEGDGYRIEGSCPNVLAA